jgi:hypothetical protein
MRRLRQFISLLFKRKSYKPSDEDWLAMAKRMKIKLPSDSGNTSRGKS